MTFAQLKSDIESKGITIAREIELTSDEVKSGVNNFTINVKKYVLTIFYTKKTGTVFNKLIVYVKDAGTQDESAWAEKSYESYRDFAKDLDDRLNNVNSVVGYNILAWSEEDRWAELVVYRLVNSNSEVSKSTFFVYDDGTQLVHKPISTV